MWYTLWIYSWSTVENTDANRLIIFCSSTTPQAFLRSSAPGALSTLVTYVVLYSLTRTTLMSPGKNEIRACRYALNFFNEHCREHYFSSCTTPQALRQSSPPDALRTLVTSVVLYSLTRATVMSPGKDETRFCGYTLLNLFIEHSGEHWWEENIFCSFTPPQAFWQSSAPGALSTLVTLAVLYSLTQATLMRPGKVETRVCGYRLLIDSLRTLENMDDNRILFVRSPHHRHFDQAQHLVFWRLWWDKLFYSR